MQAKLDDGNITITVSGGPDLSTLQAIAVTQDGAAANFSDQATNAPLVTDDSWDIGTGVINGTFSVGDVISFTPTDGDTSGRLLVVGTWSDGAEQIILDRTF